MNTTTSLKSLSKDKQREYWLAQIEQWKQSNLKQHAYCTKVGINYSAFVYWKGILSSSLSQGEAKTFVPVQLTKHEPAAVTNVVQEIKIKLTTGHVVYLPATMDPKTIAQLIHSLGTPHA